MTEDFNCFVLTTGTFNLIHPGHIEFFHNLKNLQQFVSALPQKTKTHVAVGLDSDERNRRLKGDKAIFSAEERARILRSIKYIDEVIIFDEYEELFEYARDYFIKASEYDLSKIDPKLMDILKANGISIAFTPYDDSWSTTKIFNIIRGQK